MHACSFHYVQVSNPVHQELGNEYRRYSGKRWTFDGENEEGDPIGEIEVDDDSSILLEKAYQEFLKGDRGEEYRKGYNDAWKEESPLSQVPDYLEGWYQACIERAKKACIYK